MHIDLLATHRLDTNGLPLVTVSGMSPRIVISGDMYPNELRELARQMITLAIDAEMQGGHECLPKT